MYSESAVAERLLLAEQEFGFHPIAHDPSEVDDFERRLKLEGKYAYGDFGQPTGTQHLSPADKQWMLNEQAMILCDAAYFLTRYAYLRNEEGVVERFRFRVPQRIFFDIMCDLEERGAAVEIQALKARQLGVSIFSQLLIAHRAIFSYGVSAIIGSADQSKTGEMSKMLLLCYDMLPVWLRPQHTARVESDRGKLMFGHMASGISFQHGSQKFGIGTGSTPTIYHLSEVALYGDSAVMLVDEGLWKAVHASANVFGVLESTGRSNKGWWAETWYYSKENWPRCRMYPMFLPWFCGVDIYPKPAWLLPRPIPENWQPNADTRKHIAKSELFVHSTPLLEKHLLAEQTRRGAAHDSHWRLPRIQQWYWEVNHEEAKAKGNESSFLQEMAGDDDEALQHSVESVFGHRTIEVIDSARKRDYTAYGISGEAIEDSHEPPPEDIDYHATRIPTRLTSQKGDVYRWEFIPLQFSSPLRETSPDDAIGKLFVYHPPAPGIRYSIGIDTAGGQGQDSTAISVWGLGYGQQPDFQAAEFVSPFVSHTEAYAFGAAIGTFYGRFMTSETTRWPLPYMCIEQLAAVGDICQLQMIRMGYPLRCFHKMTRYDGSPNRIIRQRRAPEATKLGWFTGSWSRPILTGNFVQSAQNGWARINSSWLIEEMKAFEVHTTARGKERLEHSEDSHDDRIFSAAMAIFCPHDLDVLAERSKKRMIEPEGGAMPPISIAEYAPGITVSASAMKQTRTLDLQDILYSGGRDLRRQGY